MEVFQFLTETSLYVGFLGSMFYAVAMMYPQKRAQSRIIALLTEAEDEPCSDKKLEILSKVIEFAMSSGVESSLDLRVFTAMKLLDEKHTKTAYRQAQSIIGGLKADIVKRPQNKFVSLAYAIFRLMSVLFFLTGLVVIYLVLYNVLSLPALPR